MADNLSVISEKRTYPNPSGAYIGVAIRVGESGSGSGST
jgi:hypothetical protein